MAELMGIINLTPDSFYPGSRFLTERGTPDEGRIARVVYDMLSQGASIIDIGACSSRPGASDCDETQEWRRLSPVLKRMTSDFPGLRFSVDTSRSSIVRKVFDLAGRFMVNDISSGENDNDMLRVCGSLGLEFVAMHKRGNPAEMSALTDYPDGVLSAVMDYFRNFSVKAEDAGVIDWILDPGFGFAKTVEQNYELLSSMASFKSFGHRILVGISRKSMVYKPLGLTPETCLSETQVLHFAALQSGADILRVHDVAQASRTMRLWELYQ